MPPYAPPADVAPPPADWRRRLAPLLALAMLLGVGWFLERRIRQIDWSAVGDALQAYPPAPLALALLCAAATLLAYANYDLLARRYVGHTVRPLKVLGVGLVSYAFTLNLGSTVGGIGFRWRLYSRLGLKAVQIGRIFALGLVTNWSGYLLVAGLLLATHAFEPPPPLTPDPELQRLLGLALLALPLLYLVWCATATRRTLRLRGHEFVLPRGHIAALQIPLGALHWLLMGAIIWWLMPQSIGYATVLGTLMCGAVAGLVIRVPGGLGVIEAVFIASLSDRVPESQLVAALLAFRLAFYWLPLLGAAALHFGFEWHTRHQHRVPR